MSSSVSDDNSQISFNHDFQSIDTELPLTMWKMTKKKERITYKTSSSYIDKGNYADIKISTWR